MKPLIVFSDVTVDGFMAGPDNDLGFMVDDPELADEVTGELMSVADTIVVGRKSFPEMASYWTTADSKVLLDRARATMPNFDGELVGDAGHSLPLDRAAAIAPRIRAFVATPQGTTSS